MTRDGPDADVRGNPCAAQFAVISPSDALRGQRPVALSRMHLENFLPGKPQMNAFVLFFRRALHATAAILAATTLTACGGDNSGPAGSAADNSASSTSANGG